MTRILPAYAVTPSDSKVTLHSMTYIRGPKLLHNANAYMSCMIV